MSNYAKDFPGIVGIDLGTTYSCIAVFRNQHLEVVPNDQGTRTMPSVICFTPERILVGEEARRELNKRPVETIFDTKRLIGRKYNDPEVVQGCSRWPFEVQCDEATGAAVISVREKKTLYPEEISAILLRRLRKAVEAYLQQNVTRAVVTIPAHFNDSQREKTRIAGQIAGLEVVRILNEPTAAALCYGLNQPTEKARILFVFDLGGGTFDVSIIRQQSGVLEVLATAGNTYLGGQDFNETIVKMWLEDIKSKMGESLKEDETALRTRLQELAEFAKRALSRQLNYETGVSGLSKKGEIYNLTLTRDQFDTLNMKLFARCMEKVEEVLQIAKLTKHEVDKVLLVGGSTRIVKIQTLLRSFFEGISFSQRVNPDEVVACGAAVQGAILSEAQEQQSEQIQDMLLLDVTSLSIGVNVEEGRMDVLIPRSSVLPTRVTKEYHTIDDYQTEVLIEIYEGERPKVEHNHLLGTFRLLGLRKRKRGKTEIAVTFSLNANGVLTVTAQEVGGGLTIRSRAYSRSLGTYGYRTNDTKRSGERGGGSGKFNGS